MGKTFSFTITGRLSGANDLRRADRAHWFVGAKLRKKELKHCYGCIQTTGQTLPIFENPVSVSFRWYEPDARRDIDNITCGQKAILDALVGLDVLPGDSQKWVKRIEHRVDIDRLNPHIFVTVEELEHGESSGS